MTLLNEDQRQDVYEEIALNSSSTSAIIINEYLIEKLLNYLQKDVHVLEERFNYKMYVLYFPRHHYLYEPFNQKVKQLIESGFVSKWRLWMSWNSTYNAKEGQEPSVLTMDTLNVGFLAWFCFLCLSTLVFFMELIVFHRAVLLKPFPTRNGILRLFAKRGTERSKSIFFRRQNQTVKFKRKSFVQSNR